MFIPIFLGGAFEAGTLNEKDAKVVGYLRQLAHLRNQVKQTQVFQVRAQGQGVECVGNPDCEARSWTKTCNIFTNPFRPRTPGSTMKERYRGSNAAVLTTPLIICLVVCETWLHSGLFLPGAR